MMTDEEIHNIYLHMSGKAEGLFEATGEADFPVLFARAILEYEGLTKDVQNMASKSTYKEALEIKVGCAECGVNDNHALYCVVCAEKFVGGYKTWVGLTKEEITEFDTWHDNREEEVGWCNPSEIVAYIEAKLKEKNGKQIYLGLFDTAELAHKAYKENT